MNDRVTLAIGAVGAGKKSWNLPGGYRVASCQIDNPSGSWLKILQDDTYVPPYTIGYVHNFPTSVQSVDIVFSNGPAGQISTQQGDSLTLEIDSEHQSESLGTAQFIDQFTPVSVASDQQTVTFSVGITARVLIAAIANKRFRILTVNTTLVPFASNPAVSWDTGASVRFFQNTDGVDNVALVRLNSFHPVDSQVFSGGLDCVVGRPLKYSAFVDFFTLPIGIMVTYQII